VKGVARKRANFGKRFVSHCIGTYGLGNRQIAPTVNLVSVTHILDLTSPVWGLVTYGEIGAARAMAWSSEGMPGERQRPNHICGFTEVAALALRSSCLTTNRRVRPRTLAAFFSQASLVTCMSMTMRAMRGCLELNWWVSGHMRATNSRRQRRPYHRRQALPSSAQCLRAWGFVRCSSESKRLQRSSCLNNGTLPDRNVAAPS
jgi:hypothetical protein